MMDTTIINNVTTNITDFDEFIPYSARIETYLVPILFSIIFVSGIVGNLIICLIFIRHPSIRNVPNTYVTDFKKASCDNFLCHKIMFFSFQLWVDVKKLWKMIYARNNTIYNRNNKKLFDMWREQNLHEICGIFFRKISV